MCEHPNPAKQCFQKADETAGVWWMGKLDNGLQERAEALGTHTYIQLLPVTPETIIWLVDIPWPLHTYCCTFGLSLTLLVLNIYNENFQEIYMQWILCLISRCIKTGQGDSWGGHQKCHWEGKPTLKPLGSWLPLNRIEKQVVGHLKFIENLLRRRLFSVN